MMRKSGKCFITMFYNLLLQPTLQKTLFDSLLMSPPPKISKIVYLPKTKWTNYIVGIPLFISGGGGGRLSFQNSPKKGGSIFLKKIV